MKIAYVTTFDLENPKSWPRRHLGLYGAGAKIIQTLKEEEVEITAIGPVKLKGNPITRLKWQFYRNVCKKNFYGKVDPQAAKYRAWRIQSQLSLSEADILLCPENSIPLANVKSDKPLVLWTDTTLGSLIDFYPYLSNLCKETRDNLLAMERQVLENCSLVVLTSQWAAQKAHELYDISPSKIKIIPRGSNHTHSFTDIDIKTAIQERPIRPCKLLFVGVDWKRKGGSKAVDIAQELNRKGIATELHIVGCNPPTSVPDFVKTYGFINRATDEGKAKISALFKSSHFLIFPTKADTFGIVLSEAASYGVPALASEVGGISSVVKADITGKTFPIDSSPAAYCEFIQKYMMDSGRYQALAHSTFAYYKQHISWAAVGKEARAAFEALLH
ncbi:glycosyltransferase family 4 protein [cf. Phormidesmis sp. LEGE 11477]|uniref:glycosyltransferase family 4 protein n=1 Tax=cf. Phormidesmis sp. LEGE 11477 TaxID=1828680 RepID=UPI00187E86ED|nr:glycosyltransferase family 4 protein [cf. Phormidesmis sp. LEGE 11477]MBE9059391.1 glycosyltransferase family 4 protein [cf. Phormidesmis sp. LEGE 11477]